MAAVLQNWEWANRIGIMQNLFDAAQPDLRVKYMAMLTLWRWPSFNKRSEWNHDVDGLANASSGDRAQFWRELRHKKYGLYGSGVSTDADPMALVRHPWSLKTHEFKEAYAQIVEDQSIPNNIPDDRTRYSSTLGLIGAGVGAVGGAVALTGAGAVPGGLIALGGTAIGATGAGLDMAMDRREDSEKKKITGNMLAYVAIYKLEADRRMREITP